MKILYTLLFFLYSTCLLNASNEFYINGGGVTSLVYINGIAGTNPTLYINGEVKNQAGSFINSNGIIELNGDWNNTVIPSGSYTSTGLERFSGTNNQIISGYWDDSVGNTNQFYNLKINKTAGYISAGQNTRINAAGSIQFENTGGIFRTGLSSLSNTGDYPYFLYLQNPSSSSLSGYNWPSGTTKYIEGKLKRKVNAAATYQFPVGFQPSDKDGLEPFELIFNAVPATNAILGYIRPAAVGLFFRNVLCDVGKDPGPGNQAFPLCAGAKDGIYDLYYLDQDLSHEWAATADAATAVNYNITLYPGSVLDVLSYYSIPAACDATYSGNRIRVVAKDGKVGGTSQLGPGRWTPFTHLVTYLWCSFDDNTLPITLSGQTSFSTFRIHGTSTLSNTALPVELTDLKAAPVNNEYIKIDWTTASEYNNKEFQLERSTDGSTFEYITTISGNGTTSIIHNYSYNDYQVHPNIVYYYRLKQVDLNSTYKYSHFVSAKIIGNHLFSVLAFPSPASTQINLQITSEKKETLSLSVFNALGQLMFLQPVSVAQQSIQNIQLPVSEWADGIYIVKLTDSENKIQLIKFVKQ